MSDNNNEIVTEAINCGLVTLSDPNLRIPASSIELLANFKGILRGLLNGELVLATPDRLLPQTIEPIKRKDNDND